MIRIVLLALLSVLYVSEVQGQTSLHKSYSVLTDPAKQPLILVDGVQFTAPEGVQSIDTYTMYELKVLKGEQWDFCINKYGGLAKNGVISVTTKGFVANQWYNRFAKYQPTIKFFCEREDFDYNSYRVFLNEQLLDNEKLWTWEPLFENKQITQVGFQSIGSGEAKGEIRIICKAKNEEN